MQATGRLRDNSFIPLGQRRGVSDVARTALDLNWADIRAESEAAARSRAYPSPPMSGSPPLPPTTSPEAGDRSQAPGPYQTIGQPQDVYGSAPSHSHQAEDIRASLPPSLPPPPSSMRSYQHPSDAPPDRMGYYRQPEDSLGRSYSYPPPGGHSAPPTPQQPPYPPIQGPPGGLPGGPGGPGPQAAYPAATQTPAASGTSFGSPKPSRKAKGHVPSACVPCKRAHLRCDTQRPCSRCTMNGKEDACVDVQHKKRGRPRLRDDRDTRFEGSRFPTGPDAALRRPLGMSYPSGPIGSGYEDTLRRSNQAYRVLKSQPSEPMASRYIERASPADANVYAPPLSALSIATRVEEPVAFLTMDLEVVKASPSFVEATGATSIEKRKLYEILVLTDRDKAAAYQRQMKEDQERREPRYLPPIYDKQEGERVIQDLSFTPEAIAQFSLDRQDRLTFNSSDGQPRTHAVQFGLAKARSIYFVVFRIHLASRFPYPSPSPHSREAPYPYPPQGPPQQAYAQRTPVSATFDPNRHRYDQGPPSAARQGGAVPGQMPGLSPGVSPGIPSYQPSPSRPDYAVGPTSYQIPRSELPPTTRPTQAPSFQLPPIRAQPQVQPQSQSEVPGPDPSWQRDDRSGRVDIGGLMNKPQQQQPPRRQQ